MSVTRNLLSLCQNATVLTYRGLNRIVHIPLSTISCRLYCALWGAHVGKELRAFGTIRLRNYGSLVIGPKVEMRSGFSNAVGGDRKLSMVIGPGGSIEIGEGCKLSNSTVIAFTSIRILAGSFLGGGCDIYDTDFHPLQPYERLDPTKMGTTLPIVIGPRAFVGAHSLILKGVKIGEGAVVAAGSVVTKSIPPFELWGGVPAHFIRSITIEKT